MQETKITAFNFEGTKLRVFYVDGNPWFAATDIARALGIKDPKDAVKNLRPSERSGLKPDRGGMLTIVSESGMYTMILRSDAAIKEGTAAFRFRVYVTDEVLPQIRRTGRYECPLANSATNDAKINETEQYEIQEAIRKRAKNCSVHYQTIYHALYDRFRVASYKDLRRDQLSAALTFIEVVPLTPQIEAPKPEIPEGFYLVDRNTLLAMHSIVYLMWLNKPEFDQIGCAMRCLGSNITGRFRGFTLETQGPRKVVERTLEKFGFDCRLPSGEVLSIPL